MITEEIKSPDALTSGQKTNTCQEDFAAPPAGQDIEAQKTSVALDGIRISICDSVTGEPKEASLLEVLDGIKDGRWAAPVESIRSSFHGTYHAALASGVNGALARERAKDATKKEKRQLPCFTPAGTFSPRNAAGLIARSGLISADLDDLGEGLPRVRAALARDPHVLCDFLSPTGTGLKVLVVASPSRTHEENFQVLQLHAEEAWGVRLDAHCKDVCRLCFVSHDPELRVNFGARPLASAPKGHAGSTATTTTCSHDTCTSVVWGEHPRRTAEEVREILKWIPPQPEYELWLRIASGVWDALGETEGTRVLKEWSPAKDGDDPLEYERKFKHRLERIGFGTVVHIAKSHGYSPRGVVSAAVGDQSPASSSATTNEDPTIVFTMWTPRQFLNHATEAEPSFLGEAYLEKGAWTSLVGAGGLGKTRLALWLCLCQITGRSWCGLETRGSPQKCLFFSTENGVQRWKRDFERILPAFTEQERALIEAHLEVLALTAGEDGDLSLSEQLVETRLTATLSAKKPGILIFDPFADMVAGDENSNADMRETVHQLRRIVRKSCPEAATLLVHHARTGAQNMANAGSNYNSGNYGRGAKFLYSSVRCELQLAAGSNDDPSQLEHFLVK